MQALEQRVLESRWVRRPQQPSSPHAQATVSKPKFTPALAPWLAQMRPFTMTSASQFLPDGPTPLNSEEWVDDYNLTRVLGEVDSTVRTPPQSEIGLFWTEHPGKQYARAFNYLVENYSLNAMESARLMAILWTGVADAAIG